MLLQIPTDTFSGLFSSSRQMTVCYLKVGHGSFRPHSFHYDVSQSYWRLYYMHLIWRGYHRDNLGLIRRMKLNLLLLLLLCRSLWPRRLRRRYAGARLLGLRVRIPPGIWCLSRVSVVWYQVEKGLCAGLITRPEESHGVWCVCVWLLSLDNEEALAH